MQIKLIDGSEDIFPGLLKLFPEETNLCLSSIYIYIYIYIYLYIYIYILPKFLNIIKSDNT